MDSDKKHIVFNQSNAKELKNLEVDKQYKRLMEILVKQEATISLMKSLKDK